MIYREHTILAIEEFWPPKSFVSAKKSDVQYSVPCLLKQEKKRLRFLSYLQAWPSPAGSGTWPKRGLSWMYVLFLSHTFYFEKMQFFVLYKMRITIRTLLIAYQTYTQLSCENLLQFTAGGSHWLRNAECAGSCFVSGVFQKRQ